MLCKDTKAIVRGPYGDTDYFDIVSGVLQRDTLALFALIICLDYVQRTSIDLMKENSLTLKRQEVDADNTNDTNVCCITWSKQQVV